MLNSEIPKFIFIFDISLFGMANDKANHQAQFHNHPPQTPPTQNIKVTPDDTGSLFALHPKVSLVCRFKKKLLTISALLFTCSH